MIWFVTRQIFVLMYYLYKPQKQSPPAPASFNSMTYFDGKLPEWMLHLMANFGGKFTEWIPQLKTQCSEKLSKWIPQLKAYFDGKLLEWIPLLADRPFFFHDCWMMRCPKYLIDCCPLVKIENGNWDILGRLEDLNPLQAFSYLLVRRLAEFIVQLTASWLIIIWTIALAIFICFSIFYIKQKRCKTTKSIHKNSSSLLTSICVWLFLFLLPLSFVILYSHQSVFIPSYPLRGNIDERRIFPTLWDLMPREKKRPSYKLLNTLDLLRFSSLYTQLYIEDMPAEMCQTASQKLCHTTKIFLTWWSILTFLSLMYSVAALSLYVFIFLPLKNIFPRRSSLDSSKEDTTSKKEREKITKPKLEPEPEYFMSGRGDLTFPKKKEKTMYMKLESGDRPEIQKPKPKYNPPKSAFKPRYVTRGVKACLD